jgi:hypothetical protein
VVVNEPFVSFGCLRQAILLLCPLSLLYWSRKRMPHRKRLCPATRISDMATKGECLVASSYKVNAHNKLSFTPSSTFHFSGTTRRKLVGCMLNTRLGTNLAICTTISWGLRRPQRRISAHVALPGVDGRRVVRHLVRRRRQGRLRATLSSLV